MLQEINFYSLLPRPSKAWFSFKKLFIVYGIFIFLLILKWGNLLWTHHKLVKEHEQAVILLADAEARFKKLMAAYPTVDTKNIQNIGENLRAELMNELKILKMLAKSSRFSAYMQGLSQATSEGAWLTDITFSAEEPHIILKGNALQPQFVESFLEKVGLQPIFAELPFKISDLNQIEVDKNIIFSFTISTPSKVKT